MRLHPLSFRVSTERSQPQGNHVAIHYLTRQVAALRLTGDQPSAVLLLSQIRFPRTTVPQLGELLQSKRLTVLQHLAAISTRLE